MSVTQGDFYPLFDRNAAKKQLALEQSKKFTAAVLELVVRFKEHPVLKGSKELQFFMDEVKLSDNVTKNERFDAVADTILHLGFYLSDILDHIPTDQRYLLYDDIIVCFQTVAKSPYSGKAMQGMINLIEHYYEMAKISLELKNNVLSFAMAQKTYDWCLRLHEHYTLNGRFFPKGSKEKEIFVANNTTSAAILSSL